MAPIVPATATAYRPIGPALTGLLQPLTQSDKVGIIPPAPVNSMIKPKKGLTLSSAILWSFSLQTNN